MCTIVGINFSKNDYMIRRLAYKNTQCKYSIHKVTYESTKLGHLEKSFLPGIRTGPGSMKDNR